MLDVLIHAPIKIETEERLMDDMADLNDEISDINEACRNS